MFLLVNVLMPDEPAANLTVIWNEVKALYTNFKVKHRYSNMKMTMFGNPGSVKLKGTAAEIRCFIQVLHPLWKKHHDPTKEIHRKIELCLRTCLHMECLLDEHRDAFALPGFKYPHLLHGPSIKTKSGLYMGPNLGPTWNPIWALHRVQS